MNTHNYDYVFRDNPEVKEELSKLGLELRAILVDDDEYWPGLVLPSGSCLLIMQDPEGNGPGAISVETIQ